MWRNIGEERETRERLWEGKLVQGIVEKRQMQKKIKKSRRRRGTEEEEEGVCCSGLW